tara:strand:- start:573 stop:803 length:231 start_codon:yes stop_codon:yes gene_type:complete
LDKDKKMNEVCKMCFGSGFLFYCVIPPKPCPRCKTKGVVKIRKDSNLMSMYWIKLIGITTFIVLLLALFYVKIFVN